MTNFTHTCSLPSGPSKQTSAAHFDLRRFLGAGVLSICLLARALAAPVPTSSSHADPLNFDPAVRDAYTHFYNLDYDGALTRMDAVIQAHPAEPMAYGYALMVTVFRELYHQDLLDTTYYAHDSFLTTQRHIEVPQSVRERIEYLTRQVVTLADRRLKVNPEDKDALFARGYARGLHAAFITLVDHSYFAAARQGLAARSDSEAVLRIDPDYADANMAVGIQQFAVASLPRIVRMAVGIAGVGGNKETGLALVRRSAEKGVVTSVESRTTLSLFLRHEGRYEEALAVQRALAQQYPHDYLFRLEEANLTKDQGNGPAAIAIYKAVLADARKPGFFTDPRLALAWFGLADTERGQNNLAEAARHYMEAADQPNCSDWLRRRAQLNAGEVFDLLQDRPAAIAQYDKAMSGGGDQSQAEAARRYSIAPYTGK